MRFPAKKHYKRFEIPLFGGELLLFWDREQYKIASICLHGRQEDDDLVDHSGGCVTTAIPDECAPVHLMGIFDYDLCIVVHESTHVMQNVVEIAGVNDRETEAYLNHNIFEMVNNYLEQKELTICESCVKQQSSNSEGDE